MIVKLKDCFKDTHGGYFNAREVRYDNINKNKYSEHLNETTKQMFAVNSINKLKQLLEDEIFYEKILDSEVKKFYNSIQQGKFTLEEFIDEYNITGAGGFINVGIMLGAL